jgi:peroxiredoxin
MTAKWRDEFVRPRGPAGVPQAGEEAPDFTLPFARVRTGADGQPEVEYGATVTLSALRGQPVVLNLTRIVSDRFF